MKKPQKRAALILYADGSLLMQRPFSFSRHPVDPWKLPEVEVKWGERPEAAIYKAIRAEIGYVLDEILKMGVQNFRSNSQDVARHLFASEYRSGTALVSSDGQIRQFVPVWMMPLLNIWPSDILEIERIVLEHQFLQNEEDTILIGRMDQELLKDLPFDTGLVADQINRLFSKFTSLNPPVHTRDSIEEVISSPHQVLFFAWHDGHIVGAARLITPKTLFSASPELSDVVVDTHYHGRGIASQLVESAIEYATQLDYGSIMLASTNNLGPIDGKLYESLGFYKWVAMVWRKDI